MYLDFLKAAPAQAKEKRLPPDMVIRKGHPSTTTVDTSSSSDDENAATYRAQKAEEIEACLNQRNVDLWHLRELALTRGGLLSPAVRKRAWHKLLGINVCDLRTAARGGTGENGVAAADPDMIAMMDQDELELIRRDVGRSAYFRFKSPAGTGSTTSAHDASSALSDASTATSRRDGMTQITASARNLSLSASSSSFDIRDESTSAEEAIWEQCNLLASVIMTAIAADGANNDNDITVIDEDEKLHYYQGLHDVASVVLYNINVPSAAAAILEKIATFHLRDATRQDFTQISTMLDVVFFPLLSCIDEEVHDFLLHCDCSADMFLPWIITWFAHDVHNIESISRLFDAFLASHPLMPVYLSVAIVVHPRSRKQIFATECCAGMMQITVKQLLRGISFDFEEAETDIPFQDMIDDAISFMKKIHPGSILQLCKRYHNEKASSILLRTASIMALKPAQSWALASSTPSDSAQRQRRALKDHNTNNSVDVAKRTLSPLNYIVPSPVHKPGKECARAKIASGRVDTSCFREGDHKTYFDLDESPAKAAVAKNMAGKLVKSLKKAAATRRSRIGS